MPAEISTKSPPGPVRYALGDARIDLERRELVRAGAVRHLRARSFDVLAYLVENAGRVVGKEELIDRVWQGAAVTDDSIVQCMVDIRKALGDDDQTRIATVSGRGYRCGAAVRVVVDPAPAAALERGHDGPARATAAPRGFRPRRWLPAAGLLTAGLAATWLTAAGSGRPGRPELASRAGSTLAPHVTLQPGVRDLMAEGDRVVQRRSQSELHRARTAYEQAVALDGRYAPARAALANSLVLLSVFGVERPGDVLPEAVRQGRLAVQLDPTYAFGWAALAHAQVQWTGEWAEAGANYRRALALDPELQLPAFLLAHLFVGLGRGADAVAQSLDALRLNPGSALLNASSGIVHNFAGRPDEALAFFERAFELDPSDSTALFWHGRALAAAGRYEEAMEQALRSRQEMGNPPTWLVGYTHARAGRLTEARAVLDAMTAHAATHYVPAIEFAYLHVAMGERDEALRWMEEAVRERSRWTELMAVDPILEPLRATPRFGTLVTRMGLPGGS